MREETRYRSEKQRQGGQNQITKIIQTGYLIFFFSVVKEERNVFM